MTKLGHFDQDLIYIQIKKTPPPATTTVALELNGFVREKWDDKIEAYASDELPKAKAAASRSKKKPAVRTKKKQTRRKAWFETQDPNQSSSGEMCSSSLCQKLLQKCLRGFENLNGNLRRS